MTQVTVTKNQDRFMSWTTDVLVYIVVLNLFVEFYDAVVIESFWISILTAILLKALLALTVGLMDRVGDFFKRQGTTVMTVVGFSIKFAILFTSKFIILEVVSFVFGERVQLGDFLDILVLIIAMMAARAIIAKIYKSLGEK